MTRKLPKMTTKTIRCQFTNIFEHPIVTWGSVQGCAKLQYLVLQWFSFLVRKMSHIIHSSFFWPRSGRKIFLAFLARIFENIHHFFIIFCAHFQKYSSFFHHFFFVATFLKNDNHFFVIFRSFMNIFPSFLAIFWWFWGVIFWGQHHFCSISALRGPFSDLIAPFALPRCGATSKYF